MSVYASRWTINQLARPDCPLSLTARAVVLILAADANYRTGYATAGQARLAAMLGVHPDTVWRAVRELTQWGPLPRTDVTGKGTRWHFPTSPDVEDVHTPRADAGGSDIHTPRAGATTPRAHAGGPPAPTRGKGSGSTDVDRKGAPGTIERPGRPGPPPWVAQGITLRDWQRAERAAGRLQPFKQVDHQ